MVKIGLLSDTHGYLDEQILSFLKPCDEIWHAGDIGAMETYEQLEQVRPVRAVYGNIDGGVLRQILPETLSFNIEGLEVMITHIGGYPPRYNSHSQKLLKNATPGLFVTGHSHILKIMPDKARKNMLFINPGAAGRHGFHKMRTLVRFKIHQAKIEGLEVVELGPRSPKFKMEN
ncbi:MAG: metallophosphatase family protein [Cyclobacteriaceae bacterium]|nr:metallophosphatase family protein [Cyclobacteriaceae bacterium]